MKELLRRRDGWSSLVSWNTRDRLIGFGMHLMSLISVIHDTDLLSRSHFLYGSASVAHVFSCILLDLKR